MKTMKKNMASMKPLIVDLAVVEYREGKTFLAHSTDFDLVGEGTSRSKALRDLGVIVSLQIEARVKHDNPRNLIIDKKQRRQMWLDIRKWTKASAPHAK